MFNKELFKLAKNCNSTLFRSKQELELLLPLDLMFQVHEHPNTKTGTEAQYQCLVIFGTGANSMQKPRMPTSKYNCSISAVLQKMLVME